MVEEIRIEDLDPQAFVAAKVDEISSVVGDGVAVNALSGGVDSSAVTMLGHKAIGDRLKTYFIDNGLMRKDEPASVVALFAGLGVHVELIDERESFFEALRGVTDPEEKREAITQTFYKDVFGRLVRDSGAKYLLQGTILTDVDETVAGIKRQHNVFEQLGIDPQAPRPLDSPSQPTGGCPSPVRPLPRGSSARSPPRGSIWSARRRRSPRRSSRTWTPS
jgi:GMP synthase (glutamine-hydrolysing)